LWGIRTRPEVAGMVESATKIETETEAQQQKLKLKPNQSKNQSKRIVGRSGIGGFLFRSNQRGVVDEQGLWLNE
jgi:hypothetical protein